MKLAIAHDFIRHGGAEKVLEQFVHLWPSSKIYTLLAETNPDYESWDIQSSRLQTFLHPEKYRWPMALYPGMVDRLASKVDWDVDMLLSSSVSYMKNLRAPKHVPHLCYIYRPAMFAYDRREQFLAGYHPAVRPFLRFASNKFRTWDQAGAENPNRYVACSKYVASKVKEIYRQDSDIVYPPVETSAFQNAGDKANLRDYYFTATRLESYKKVETIVEACTKLNLPLKVAGDGPMKKQLLAIAGPSIEFLGYVESAKMPELVANCRAFLFPSEEDFGIAPVEALATGRPVVAFGAAGALETVKHGETGLHYPEQTASSVMLALQAEQEFTWNSSAIRKSAQRFSVPTFHKKFKATVDSFMKDWKPRA